MALHTDDVPGDAASQSRCLEGTVRIVTIAAFHQAFVDLMVERLRKCGLHVRVAGIAELRLRNLEKAASLPGMNAMAPSNPVCNLRADRSQDGLRRTQALYRLLAARLLNWEECL
jgi:hypothetical protein